MEIEDVQWDKLHRNATRFELINFHFTLLGVDCDGGGVQILICIFRNKKVLCVWFLRGVEMEGVLC